MATERPLTDDARRVIDDVADRAYARLLPVFGKFNTSVAKMLSVLSMLRWEPKCGLAAIQNLDVDIDALARELDETIKEESGNIPAVKPQLDILPSGQRCMVVDLETVLNPFLTEADHEARKLGHTYIGTEHLMLAAIHFPSPRLRSLLRRHQVGYDAAKQAILSLLGPASQA